MTEALIPQDKELALEQLTADERIAYDRHLRDRRPVLAPSFNQRLYDLYLRGLTCEQISLLNPGLSLGDVVRSRIDGRWDEKRAEYTSGLLSETSGLLRQTAAEAIQFLSLLLSVAHKQYGEQLKRYLATGDPKELGSFQILNFRSYQAVVDTIAKLIGADQKKTVTHKIVGGVPVASDIAPEQGGIVGVVGTGRLTPAQADAMRAALEKNK